MPSHRQMNRPSQFCLRSSQVFALSFVTRQREDKDDDLWSCVSRKRESEKEHEPRDDRGTKTEQEENAYKIISVSLIRTTIVQSKSCIRRIRRFHNRYATRKMSFEEQSILPDS